MYWTKEHKFVPDAKHDRQEAEPLQSRVSAGQDLQVQVPQISIP